MDGEIIAADSSTTIFLYGPKTMCGQNVRIGVHAHNPMFTREQLSSITDRAWKIAPQAFPDHAASIPVLMIHYNQDTKKLHVDAPAIAVGVRSALDRAGPDGMNLVLDALRGYKMDKIADALVLFFKKHETALLEATSPADVGAVVRDALNAMDAAAYPQVDVTHEAGVINFFKLI